MFFEKKQSDKKYSSFRVSEAGFYYATFLTKVGIAVLIIALLTSGVVVGFREEAKLAALITGMAAAIPLIGIVLSIINSGKIYLSEMGVSKSWFGKYFKQNMTWDEIFEIRVVKNWESADIIFSKVDLEGLKPRQCRAIKEKILFRAHHKWQIDLIKQYTDIPIKNLAALSDGKRSFF